ncbi:hypothetical protein ACFVW1_20680 [Streptomyces olivochromogenes]|uniref:hypothetical protein n=1 Tax=Streptomyces olivochromogenes TaxID=1963 RepID=UPI0036DA6AFC
MAITALRDNTPGRITTMLPAYEPEKVRQYWRDAFAAIVEVLPPSAWVLQEAAFREANVLAPCKRLEVKRVNKPGPSPLSSSLVSAVPGPPEPLLILKDAVCTYRARFVTNLS